jgi:hypothetical protein
VEPSANEFNGQNHKRVSGVYHLVTCAPVRVSGVRGGFFSDQRVTLSGSKATGKGGNSTSVHLLTHGLPDVQQLKTLSMRTTDINTVLTYHDSTLCLVQQLSSTVAGEKVLCPMLKHTSASNLHITDMHNPVSNET